MTLTPRSFNIRRNSDAGMTTVVTQSTNDGIPVSPKSRRIKQSKLRIATVSVLDANGSAMGVEEILEALPGPQSTRRLSRRVENDVRLLLSREAQRDGGLFLR